MKAPHRPSADPQPPRFWRSRYAAALVILGAVALYFLLTEHRAHVAGALPYVLLIGFPLLTFGVVTGALFTQRVVEMGGAALLRTTLGYATWGLLAAVLLLRQIIGLRGRRAAYGTLAGVACVLLVMLVYAVRGGAA